ncbi:MAG TPA: HAMP domain-containing sensor histidine kinase [Planctomycetota bacterium]
MTITVLTNRATTQVAAASEGIRAAEELDDTLLAYNREHFLYARSGSREHLQAARQYEIELHDWLGRAHRYAETAEEEQVLSRTETKVNAFIQRQNERSQGTGPRAFADYVAASTEVDDIRVDTVALSRINLEQGRDAQQTANRLTGIAKVLGIVLAAVVPLTVLSLLLLIRRQIYFPFLFLRETLIRYTAGEKQVRAPASGPQELREIALLFNDMADKLAQQRQMQLGFLAAVAHDLRNPLTALKTSVALVSRGGRKLSDEQLGKQCALIKRQVDRLERMVGDFLDVSLIDGGRLELRTEVCDLCEIVRNVAELYNCGSQHPIRLSLPESPLRACCDTTRMEQVLGNLINNAMKYSAEGASVEVSLEAHHGEAIFSVTDRGLGIAPEDQKRLFEPFARVGESQRRTPGLGLGLSVVKRLAEAHHGRVELESVPGVGSTFRVRIPAGVEPLQLAADVEKSRQHAH